MDIIENWRVLCDRMKEHDTDLVVKLAKIHMGVFDELKKYGYLILIGEKPVSELVYQIHAEERLQLAGEIGSRLTEVEGKIFPERFTVMNADCFPGCAFLYISAFLEYLTGVAEHILNGKK